MTRSIGRQHGLAEVKLWLGKTRLLTLTGAGGCGKTLLALHVAHALHDTAVEPRHPAYIDDLQIIMPFQNAQSSIEQQR